MDFLTTAELLRIALLSLGGIITIIGYWLLAQALFPKFVREAQATFERPWKNMLIGAGVFVVLSVFGVAILRSINGPLGQLLAGGVFVLLLISSLSGSAGFARKVGTGLTHPSDKDQPWRRTLRGGVAFGLTMLIPFVNIPPLIFMILAGIGGSLRVLMKLLREKRLKGKVEEDEF